MKKAGAIIFSLLMLTAMLHFSIASHYCQGHIADSKISLSGKHASCGMEDDENEQSLPGTHLSSDCCYDVVTYIGTDNEYTPSLSFLSYTYQFNFQVFNIPTRLPVISEISLKSLFTSAGPPDGLSSTRVDLSDICVFRI